MRVIHINQLIEAKKAAGRLKDLDDIKQLSKQKKITKINPAETSVNAVFKEDCLLRLQKILESGIS
jgi:hypothetical protein